MNILNDNKFLYNYAKILCFNNNLLPEELVQDTLIKVWASGKLDEKEGYYYMVLKSVFLDHCRKNKKVKTKSLVFDVIDDRGSDSGELLDRVLNFIYNCRNSDKCKEAFLLNRYFGLKYKDIAKKMGVNELRVASRVFNVQKKMKQFKRA
jgi:RNA polymerase sigma-70 factor (ECF subfamily)